MPRGDRVVGRQGGSVRFLLAAFFRHRLDPGSHRRKMQITCRCGWRGRSSSRLPNRKTHWMVLSVNRWDSASALAASLSIRSPLRARRR